MAERYSETALVVPVSHHSPWVRYFTLDEERLPYYYNCLTKETVWDRPDEYVSDDDEQSSRNVPASSSSSSSSSSSALSGSSSSSPYSSSHSSPPSSPYGETSRLSTGSNSGTKRVSFDDKHLNHIRQFSQEDEDAGIHTPYVEEIIPSPQYKEQMQQQQLQQQNASNLPPVPQSPLHSHPPIPSSPPVIISQPIFESPQPQAKVHFSDDLKSDLKETESHRDTVDEPENKNGHTEDENEIDEDDEAHFTESDGLLYQIQQMGLFVKHFSPSAAILAGALSDYDVVRLTFLQNALQTTGSDVEWRRAMKLNDFALCEYFLAFLHVGVHPTLKTLASQCLAFAGNIYGTLWVDFASECEVTLSLMLAAAEVAMNSITKLVNHNYDDIVSPVPAPSLELPYAGFDERDIKDFSLSDDYKQYVEDQKEALRRRSSHGLKGLENVTDVDAAILVWSLVLFQIFSREIPLLKETISTTRVLLEYEAQDAEEAMLRASVSNADIIGHARRSLTGTNSESRASAMRNSLRENFSQMHSGHDPITSLTIIVDQLLRYSSQVKDDAYIEFLKAVAGINFQFPAREGLASSEIAELCASLQFNESLNVNVGEGLLHILNEVGYPNHEALETNPTIKLCVDLLNAPDADGFFYLNDIKVMVDVVIRELGNINSENSLESTGDAEKENAHLIEHLRVQYTRLVAAIVAKSQWSTTAGKYRADDLATVLEVIANPQSDAGDWARAEAETVALLVREV